MIELVDIKDISGNIRFSTPINEGSKRKYLLMKEDYITLKFSLDNPIYFQLGDGVDNELGLFELIDLYKPTYNTNTGGYDYELRLDAYYWKWKNKKFFYTPQTSGREASWNLTASLDKHLDVFLDNLKALGYKFREEDFIYEIGDTVENASKLVSYDNVNLIDALTQMAETWECEWWIENHKIRFGRCEFSSPVDFKVGDLMDNENVNVNSMQRSDSQTTYATRVYAFGSTRNIPATYQKSLIFDVKKVNGRDIFDTARPLKTDFFPASTKAEGGLYPDIPDHMYHFKESDTIAKITTKKTIESLPSGNYKIKINSFSGEFLGGDRTNGIKDFVKLRAWLTYDAEGGAKQIDIFSIEKSISETPAGTGVFLDIPSKEIEFTLPNCENIIIYSEWSTKRVRTTDTYNVGLFLHNHTPALGYSNSIVVTFLSGRNAGKSYQATYNPTFIPDSSGNPIWLPEGVSASLGDRYIINNIIKGKVPDNYFSKDDKELTLNGVVQRRLMLPEGIPYVDAYRYSPTGERIDIGDERYDDPDNVEMSITEAIEEIVVFEDEYPKYIGNTDIVPKPTVHDEIDEDKKPTGNQYPIYTFKDTGLKKFTSDFLLDELRLIFQTGKLAGLDFALTLIESDSTGTTFEIVRNEDYGRYLPDDVLFPQAAHTEDGKFIPADTYVLYGFDTAFISEQMLPDAEQELYQKTIKHVKKSMIDPSTYNCEMECEYIYNDGDIRTFEAGDKVNLINKAYFPAGRQSRIIGFEWPIDIPYDHPIYTVGETAAYSRIGEIENKLDSITFKGQSYSGSAVGGGGTSVYVIGVNDKTLPSDRNTFSAKRIINEIMERAVSRTKDDTTTGVITFLKGLTAEQMSTFLEGIDVTGGISTDNLSATEIVTQIIDVIDRLTAKDASFSGNVSSTDYAEKLLGWLITDAGAIDAKSLRLREFLEVPELRYNRVSIVSGEEWNAPGGGIIEAVDEENGIIYLKLEPGETAQVEKDDICKATFNNETGFQTAYFRITEKLGDSTFKYVLRSGYAFHPCKAMHFVAYGNFTNEERQKSSYSTQNYVRYLTGVNNWDITKDMIAMQLGDLSNLKLFGIDMTGHSAYLRNIYMTGVIKQISYDGVTESRVPCFKGVWVAGSYYYYDQVTHAGSSWLCISEEPTEQEPSDESTDWLKLVSKGEQGEVGESSYRLDIIASQGATFYREGQPYSATFTCKLFYGTEEVTGTLPDACFDYTRISGDPDNDPTWNQLHKGIGPVLTITESDLVGDVDFSVTVYSIKTGKVLLTRKI